MKRCPENWTDYQMIDHGSGKKLERFGEYILVRPEPNANWQPKLSREEWEKQAHVKFEQSSANSGEWKKLKPMPDEWSISYPIAGSALKFNLSLTKFKHVGVFPEQAVNWQQISNSLQPGQKFLNLFAYTGGSSLIAKQKGAEVIHVESIKQVISWAKSNMDASGLSDIKWVLEDALKFTSREKKRGNKYDLIILDPPAFGHGPKGEKWKLRDNIHEMMQNCSDILEIGGKLILNHYATGWSERDVQNLLLQYFPNEQIEVGELQLRDRQGKMLPVGIYGWINIS